MSSSRIRHVLPVLLLFALCAAFMPGLQPGAHATGAYLLVSNGTCPSLTTCSATLPPGPNSAITIVGYGFDPNTTLNISASAPFNGVNNITTSASGTFTAYFPVNSAPSGNYIFYVQEGSNIAQVTVNLTVSGTATGGSCTTATTGTSLVVNPTTAAPGTSVTFSGAGFTPGTTVTLAGGPSAVVNAFGTFALPYTVLAVANGVYPVTATDTSGRTACASLTVSSSTSTGGATLSVSTGTVAAGQSITVSGTGFNTTGTVTLSGSGITSTPVTLGSNGAFTASIATIPTTASGTYTLTASDAVHTATTTYSLVNASGIAALTASPSVVSAGSQVSFTGSGFSGNPGVLVMINGTGFTTQFVTQTTSGTFGPTPVTIAAGTPNGSYTVTASDGTKSASTIVTVGTATSTGTTLSATPSNVTAGQATTLTGAGFTPNAAVSITGGGGNAAVTANASGGFTTSFTIPSTTGVAVYVITATDTSGRTASYNIRVGATGIAITPSASSGTPGQAVPFTITGFAANEQVVVSLANAATPTTALAGTSQTFTANASGAISGSYTVPTLNPGTYSLIALGQTSNTQALSNLTVLSITPTATATAVPTVPVATPTLVPLPATSSGPTTTTFAEGNTGTTANGGKLTFTEKLYLYNPGTTSSAVTTTYYVYPPGVVTGTTITANDTVAPGSTVVRSVNRDVGNDKFVSIMVQANPGIVAETFISRVRADGTVLDSDSSLGSQSLQQNWYLAEGYTGATIQEYITLFNPGGTQANATVNYLPSDTQAPAPQSVTVPAKGRVTINVRSVYNNLVKRGSRNVAISVNSSVPIVVDRSMYWGDGSGSAKYGYSLGPGISSGKTSQSFAFLPTEAGSQSFVTVLNPGTGATTATLTLKSLGVTNLGTFTASIGPGKRYTFTVPNLLRGDHGAVTGLLTSTLPVVAEGALYFGGSPNIGRHPGLIVQGTTGGTVGARATVNTAGAQLRLYNPTNTQERVQVTTGGAGGPSLVYDSNLPANLARSITLPPGTDPRGVQVRASGTVQAVLINGGDGSTLAWGGNLT